MARSFKRTAAVMALLSGAALFASAAPAFASLTTFQTFVGNDSVATSGWGSVANGGTISTDVPVGSTVVAAYLYSSMNFNGGSPGGSLNGTAVNYATALGFNGGLQAYRADVTSIVAPVINGGPGGVYNFPITESLTLSQDGEALVVVYTNGGLPTQTVGILDGFSASGGDSTAINFSTPLHPAAPGFTAQMIIGDGFSFDGTGCTGTGQSSTISVNGTTITNSAGCSDDNVDPTPANGNLITVGDIDSAPSPFLPSIAADHEHYDLSSEILDGSTTINVNTNNPSNDDNIFLAVFLITGAGGVNAPPPDGPPPPPSTTGVPEPLTLSLYGAGLVGAVALRRRRKKA